MVDNAELELVFQPPLLWLPPLAPEAMPLQEGVFIPESAYIAVVLLRDRLDLRDWLRVFSCMN
jgi:hypothetical protein